MIFIVRMVNVLNQSGSYWLASNFMWKWLLLPFSAHWDILPAYLVLPLILFVIWMISKPSWSSFFHVVLNVKDPSMALSIVQWLLPVYFFYMFAALLDSIFYGFGFTDQLALVSIITNVGRLTPGSAFLLYSLQVYTLSHRCCTSLVLGLSLAVPCACIFLLQPFSRRRNGELARK
ncbi:unnamed protein product [Durusdinium trenchii]|uniref:Uncharacterized protein n=1 Tax=Durusdinium trenchii TaxID=1381693 RepID=A0ABP0NPH1_9DINO